MRQLWAVAVGVVLAGGVMAAPKSDAEKARTKAEKKLESFSKEYDPAKKLARKGAELDKDVAELDKEIETLAALDAAAGAELKSKRDAAVDAARQAVGGAAAGQANDDFEKKLAKAQKDFDPEKKNLANADQKQVEKTKKELDELIAKMDESQRAAAIAKRDELFASVEKGIGDAKTGNLRKGIVAPTPVAAAAGVEAITAQKPSWCDGVIESYGKKIDSMRPPSPSAWFGRITEGILFSCIDPDFDVRQQVIAAYRQNLSNALLLTRAQNEQLMVLGAKVLIAEGEKLKDLDKQTCEKLKPVDGDAVARGTRSLERQAIGCGNGLSDENRMRLIDIDTPAGVGSQLAMAGLINRVFIGELPPEEQRLLLASDVAVLNQLPLDVAAFESQVTAMGLNVSGEAKARLAYFSARAKLLSLVATYKALAPKVQNLQKAVFDAPAAAVKQKPDQKVLDFVLSLESQPGPVKGCAAKAWPFFVAELKPQMKAKPEELKVSGLLAWALAECAARDADAPAMSPMMNFFAERTTAVRGPLTAAYLAYVETYNEAPPGAAGSFDDSKRGGRPTQGPLALARPRSNPVGEAALTDSIFGHANTYSPSSAGGGGVVKTVENKGASVRITFKTETFKVPDLSCVETNKIDRITPEGQIIYRSQCTKTGEHEESSTPEPVEIPAFAAAGIAPGSFLLPYWMSSNSQAVGRAFVIEAYESKARAKRTSLFGIAVP